MQLYSPHNRRRPGSLSAFRLELSGSAESLLVLFISLLFAAGALYLYSVNRSAIQGYQIRTLENNLEALKKDNAELKIEEAQTRSLSRVETGSETLRMEKVNAPETLTLGNTVAFR